MKSRRDIAKQFGITDQHLRSPPGLGAFVIEVLCGQGKDCVVSRPHGLHLSQPLVPDATYLCCLLHPHHLDFVVA